jgi:hypothetical protein
VNPLAKHWSTITSAWQTSQLLEWKIRILPKGAIMGCLKNPRNTDSLAGGTFILLKTQEAQALFEKITTSERESEEYEAKVKSHATKIDPLT